MTGVTKYLKPYVHSLEYWTFLCSRFEASVNGSVCPVSNLKLPGLPEFFCFQISIMPGVFSAADFKLHGMPEFSLLEI